MANMRENLYRKLVLGAGLAVVVGLCGLLSACDNGSKKKLHQYINSVKARKAQQIEPIPKMREVPSHNYAQANSRDPFATLRKTMAGTEVSNQPDKQRQKQPLEEFPLDALKLVGVIHKDGAVWAVISAPNGDIHSVSVGQYMGQHFGRITTIGESSLKLLEKINIAGKWENKPITLELDEDSE